jgi:hypothetical protein
MHPPEREETPLRITASDILPARPLTQEIAKPTQKHVPRLMAKGIVEQFETIEVQHE